jgi:hypothetical protein
MIASGAGVRFKEETNLEACETIDGFWAGARYFVWNETNPQKLDRNQ